MTAHQQHEIAVSVIRASAGIFLHAPPELGHHDDDDILHGIAHIGVEGGKSITQASQFLR